MIINHMYNFYNFFELECTKNMTNFSSTGMIIYNLSYLLKKKILFSGNIQDDLPVKLESIFSIIHTVKYSKWERLKSITKKKFFLEYLFLKIFQKYVIQ
ncbi:hypothetical protein D9V65_01330 [Buchnera aphidicola (Anoecia oenotherae)]|uniref:Uncharacterized protein n=1 Tax=Buchnera aphidicola (Anoecia oenotherae) TaxID=1241833 RepID=A0A4D6XY33_9GAMM|nr:hypothetical protein D9V65_01330 [Buchnera aphidicola (Anoecia oenotherae)]